MATSALIATPGLADDVLPGGGNVAAGSASISTSGSTMTVQQETNKAVVNWNTFSVGKDNAVNFVQPDVSSAILNRVTSAAKSTLAGSITGNGQVYLVNPNGIAITPTGNVNVGSGFVASTLDITNDDFMSGKMNFKGNGASASVSNEGIITVGRGGYAALMGGTVRNSGLIAVPLGKAGLGSGEQVTLDLAGDGFMQVAVPTKTGAEGEGALIENSGTISADGGYVVISAATAREAARNAINMSGTVEARSVGGRNGAIVFGGGTGGKVKISGKINASSATAKGGSVTVTGSEIALAGATIDATGVTGGGSVKIGGDYQGGEALERAVALSVDVVSKILADATENGDGGEVILWSDNKTAFDGNISAKGAGEGNGGFAEVSGKTQLAYNGFTDLSAENGTFGDLLLDPSDITIAYANDSGVSGFTPTAKTSVISAYNLTKALEGANVEVKTASDFAEDGNITVDTDLEWAANTKLTLNADTSIFINGDITAYGNSAGVALSGGDYDLGPNYTITLPGENATFAFNGDDYTLIHDMAGLEAIDATIDSTFGKYAIANDLNAAAKTYDGYVFGNKGGHSFKGVLAGLGHKITDLSISAPDRNYVGLIAKLDGTARDLNLVDGSVSGGYAVGALTGQATGALIKNVTSTTPVVGSGAQYAGGLVGQATNTNIIDVSTNASVRGNKYTGGVVGHLYNNSSLVGAYAEGGVRGTQYVGGLAGAVDKANIVNAYAVGEVYASYDYAGGITGLLNPNSFLYWTYASGRVTASGGKAGGLVGQGNGGGAYYSYYDPTTTNTSKAFGHGVQSGSAKALTSGGERNQSTYANFDFDNTWVMIEGATRPMLQSEYSRKIGNSHQLQLMEMDKTASYTLANDIYFENASNNPESGIWNWNDAAFAPVGTGTTAAFTGKLDGKDHTIHNLKVKPNDYVLTGLFGYANGATFENLRFFSADVSGTANTGILAGYMNGGTVDDVRMTSSNVTVVGDDGYSGAAGGFVGSARNSGFYNSYFNYGSVTGTDYVGGLVGIATGSNFENTYTNTTTFGGSNVGGLVGSINPYGSNISTISTSNTFGFVTGTDLVGGLVGSSSKTNIANTYSLASVNGNTKRTGGLVGASYGSKGADAYIINSYAAGRVAGGESGVDVGGFLGEGTFTTLLNTFFSTEGTHRDNGIALPSQTTTGEPTGLTSAELNNPTTFMPLSGWDFENIWAPPRGYDVPRLYATTPVYRLDLENVDVLSGATSGSMKVLGIYGGPSVYAFGDPSDTIPSADTLNWTAQHVFFEGTVETGDGMFEPIYRYEALPDGTYNFFTGDLKRRFEGEGQIQFTSDLNANDMESRYIPVVLGGSVTFGGLVETPPSGSATPPVGGQSSTSTQSGAGSRPSSGPNIQAQTESDTESGTESRFGNGTFAGLLGRPGLSNAPRNGSQTQFNFQRFGGTSEQPQGGTSQSSNQTSGGNGGNASSAFDPVTTAANPENINENSSETNEGDGNENRFCFNDAGEIIACVN